MVASLENAATMLSLTNHILLNFAGYLEGNLFATVLDAAAASWGTKGAVSTGELIIGDNCLGARQPRMETQ
jgi:hypothetical protein